MANFLNSILDKVKGKQTSIESNGHQVLRGDMQTYLVQQFRMDPMEVANLRYVARQESVGTSSFYVRVFNPDQVRAQNITVRKYRDLDSYPELVLFYGRLNKGKVGYLKKHFVPSARH
ncbi:MAG TPA: hypothetical protein G4O18_08970 [Dehalococcoidia bacterium]|nr:hypothetical protein [Dehalococcoidia bacterium]